jgi:Rrf2 family protein
MKNAGLVDSLRGAQGGYLLGKLPEEISLADIVEALDGTLSTPNGHRGAARRSKGPSKPDALLADVWERVRQAEVAVLSAMTLRELAERHHQLDREQTLMYHI